MRGNADPGPVDAGAPAPRSSSAGEDRGSLPGRSIIEAAGERIAYREAGQGRDVVLLHGLLTSLDDMMLGLAGHLAPAHRVVALDRPGHGGSTRPRFDGSLRTQAAIVASGIEALGLRRPIVVGHSAGGAVGLTLATDFPGVIGGVVALAPIVFYEPRLETMLFGPRAVPGFGHLAARSWMRPSDAILIPLLLNAMFLPQRMPPAFAEAVPIRALAEANEMIATGEDSLAMIPDLLRNAALYSACRVPVRVLGGSADVVINNAHQGRQLARLMPDCTFERVDGVGHMLHHFVPDRIAAIVADLSAEVEARSSNGAGPGS